MVFVYGREGHSYANASRIEADIPEYYSKPDQRRSAAFQDVYIDDQSSLEPKGPFCPGEETTTTRFSMCLRKSTDVKTCCSG